MQQISPAPSIEAARRAAALPSAACTLRTCSGRQLPLTASMGALRLVIDPHRGKHRLRHDPLAHHHRLHRTMETNASQPLALA